MKIEIGEKYWVKEKDADDWLGEVTAKVEHSRTKFVLKDVTPDGQRIWHQVPGGGAYVTSFTNGFSEERFTVHANQLYRT